MASHLRKINKCLKNITRLQKNLFGGDNFKCNTLASQWHRDHHIFSAVCVERAPVITPEMTKLERDFSELMSSIEFENSKLSDHEVRHIKESHLLKNQVETEIETESTAADEGETETALDLEDKWDEELKKFVLASRTTEADKTNDTKSTERCLDSSLYLLVKQTIEGKDHWVLPQIAWEEGETMRQSAERALKSVCGGVEATFLGKAPCGVAKFDLPTPVDGQEVKVFFYKAWYRKGDVLFNDNLATDYVWVKKAELRKYCFGNYQKQIKCFLL